MLTRNRAIFRLLWSPFSLARVASGCSTAVAVFPGIGVFLAGIMFPFAAAVTAAGEPYRDLADYYGNFFRIACILTVVPLSLALIVLLPIAFYLMRFEARWPRFWARVRLVLLTPVSAFFPIVLWSLPLPLPPVAHPNFGLYGTTKPAWIASPAIAFFESTAWLSVGLLIAVLAVLNAAVAFRRLKALPLPSEQLRCQQCGYSLIGLVEPRCPECATPFNPLMLKNANDPDESVRRCSCDHTE